jgi:hypothetical protein
MNLGRDWSWYEPHNQLGEMNIVSSPTRVVASRIIHLLLTPYGGDPIHPTLGMAPKLFDPISDKSVHYFVYHAQESILRWNKAAKIGMKSVTVEAEPLTEYRNDITINIYFIPEVEEYADVLTFGYWLYTGAVYSNEVKPFRDSITLNGDPFPYFTDPKIPYYFPA